MGGTCDDRLSGFLNQNDGEGWQIPEEIDLGEYGLGEGSGGRVAVRSRFGPRYFGWQESQSVEESWRECHLHARNLLGPSGYASLLAELTTPAQSSAPPQSPATTPPRASKSIAPQTPSPQIPSPQVSSPQVPSPQVSSPQVSSPQVSSPQVSSPQVSSPQVSSPQATDPQAPFDPDTFTLSNDPVPKKKKKR
jgi:hypothetical protein